ncbi:COR domain-containing protein, partial [Candidatus Albibeggiatoa sp. nov. BB20]|uniref:COR domain-containing protein n=1 Tax=Candidatus Albibeggiatoa sp. nov. BB20 TaxID=3162723 RepID=UPI0033657964
NISYLPVSFSYLPNNLRISLRANPLIRPSLEITEQGIPAIRKYFEAGQRYGFYSNNEIKLILVGNSRAGKTSIRRRLLGQDFNEQEQSTHGIQFDTFELAIENDVKVTVKLWDFGGQDLFHATHRFFLTERALYLVVWDVENEETTTPQQPFNEFDINHTVDYWLDNIKSFASHSPIIVVQNKIDEAGERELSNQSSLRQEYPHIQHFRHVSAKTNQGIDYLRKSIQELIQQSKGEEYNLIGYEIPNNWYKVRESLINTYYKKKYINYDKYWNLCRRQGLSKKEAEILCCFLHDTATIFYFGDIEQSKKIIITNPIWAVEQLYEILKLADKKGEFTKTAIDGKLTDFSESEKLRFIDLLKRFELIFAHPTEKDRFIAPQCLVEQKPKLLKEVWQYKQQHPHIIYQYNYIHSSIMVRFLSQFGHLALDWWRYGILIKQCESMALVEADEKTKQVRVSVEKGSSENRKHLIRKIFFSFRDINLEQVTVNIPCTCEECQQQVTPYLYNYSGLETLDNHDISNSQCQNSGLMIPIQKLLWWRIKNEKNIEGKKIMPNEKKIFCLNHNLTIEYISSKMPRNWKKYILAISAVFILLGNFIIQKWYTIGISEKECNLSVQVTDRYSKIIVDNAKVSLSIPENPINYTDSEGRTKLKFSCKLEDIGIRVEKQGYEIYTNNKITVEPEQEKLEQIQIIPLASKTVKEG